jgi:hypothetical protein
MDYPEPEASDLPFRQPQHEAVEFRRDLDLAGQPAGRQPVRRRAVEQRVLRIADGRETIDRRR